jgi:cyclohexadienyl dehydratase
LQSVLERGTLRVGTTGDFNPMSVKDTATNSYKGFDIEAMEQLAKDMGVKVEFVPTEWATLIAGLTSDRYDIFAGGSSLTIARAKTVAFTVPYIEAGTVPLVLKTNAAKFKTWADLNKKGTTVAVLLGTVFEEQAKAAFPLATVRSIEKPANGYQEHRSRYLDGHLPRADHSVRCRATQQAPVCLPYRTKRPYLDDFSEQLGGPENI